MHELGVTRSIVDVVLRNACSQQAKQKVPMAFYCNDCGSTFQLAMGGDRHMCCPDCGSENYDMVTGGELLIKEIEIR